MYNDTIKVSNIIFHKMNDEFKKNISLSKNKIIKNEQYLNEYKIGDICRLIKEKILSVELIIVLILSIVVVIGVII